MVNQLKTFKREKKKKYMYKLRRENKKEIKKIKNEKLFLPLFIDIYEIRKKWSLLYFYKYKNSRGNGNVVNNTSAPVCVSFSISSTSTYNSIHLS